MAAGQRAAAAIDDGRIERQSAQAGDRLDRKSLHDLGRGDRGGGLRTALQHAPAGRDRCEPGPLRIAAGAGPGQDAQRPAGSRDAPQPGCGCQQHDRRRIGLHRRCRRGDGMGGVARQGRQPGTQTRLEPAGEAVAREPCERHDLGAGAGRREGLAMAVDRIGFLFAATDRQLRCEPRRGRDHVGVAVGPGRERRPLVALRAFIRRPRPAEAQRRTAEALHPAGDHEIGLAGPDLGGGGEDCVEPGAALGVDRGGRHGLGKARGERRDPRGIAAAIKGVAEDHVVDRVGRGARGRQDGADRRGGQHVSLDRAEGAAARGNRRPARGDDEDLSTRLRHDPPVTRGA